MSYIPLVFQNGLPPAINGANLNYIQQGIVANSGLALPVTNNRLMIDELFAIHGVQTQVRGEDSIYAELAGVPPQLSAGTIDRAKIYSDTVTQGTDTVTATNLESDKEGNTPADITECFVKGEEVTIQDAKELINEIVNYNGSDGINDWIEVLATGLVLTNGIMSYTCTGQFGRLENVVGDSASIKDTTTHFILGRIKANTDASLYITGIGDVAKHSGGGQFEVVYGIKTNNTGIDRSLRWGMDYRTSGFDAIELDMNYGLFDIELTTKLLAYLDALGYTTDQQKADYLASEIQTKGAFQTDSIEQHENVIVDEVQKNEFNQFNDNANVTKQVISDEETKFSLPNYGAQDVNRGLTSLSFKENTQYSIEFKHRFDDSAGGTYMKLRIWYTDNSSDDFPIPNTVEATVSLVSDAGKTILDITYTGSGATATDNIFVRQMMIAESSVLEPYVPFNTVKFTTNIQNTYIDGANIYRSNIAVEGDKFKFGGFSVAETIDVSTPETIVNANYQINKGEKITRLANGWMVFALRNLNTDAKIYARKPDGTIVFIGTLGYVNIIDIAITSKENYIHLVVARSGTTNITTGRFDATEGVGGDIFSLPSWAGETQADISNTSMQSCSISISDDGNEMFYAYIANDNPATNSSNVFSNKATLSGQVPTWDTAVKVTTENTSGQNNVNIDTLYREDGTPLIVSILNITSSVSQVQVRRYNGAAWVVLGNPYNGGTHVQTNPRAIFVPAAISVLKNPAYTQGLFVVGFDGKNSISPSVSNIRCRASSDLGVTWFDFGVNFERVTENTSQNQINASPSYNLEGDIFINWNGGLDGGERQLVQIENNVSTGYGSIEILTSVVGGNQNNVNVCGNFHNFDKPLLIWEDEVATDTNFYGVWQEGTTVPVTDIDIRIGITGFEPVTTISGWLYSNNIADVTLDGFLSTRDTGADESYIDLTDAEIEIDEDDNYYTSVGFTPTGGKLAALKYEMTRKATSDDVGIYRVQGAVG